MRVRNGASVAIAGMLLAAGCRTEPDPQDVEGIVDAADGVFRVLDVPAAPPNETYAAARAIVRTRFAGGSIVEDPAERTIELLPRPFESSPNRVRLYLRVFAAEGDGSRVEIFCPVDELRDDVRDEPSDPWRFIGRDAKLENRILHEIWDTLTIAPLGQDAGGGGA